MPKREARLSGKEREVLRLLREHASGSAADLIRWSKGKLARGTVYVTLGRMVEKKLATVAPASRTQAVVLYRGTALGVRMLEAIELAEAHMRATAPG